MEGLVDEVAGRRIIPDKIGAVGDKGEAHGGLLTEVTHVHRRLAGAMAFDEPVGRDLDVERGRFVDGPAVHIAGRAIGVMGGDGEFYRNLGLKKDFLVRSDLKPDQGGFVREIALGSFGDPAVEEFVGFRILLETFSTLVFHLKDRLAEEVAFLRRAEIDEALYECGMILDRVFPPK